MEIQLKKLQMYCCVASNALLFIVLAGMNTLRSEILPEVRRTQWNPGIPGGIPIVSGTQLNVIDYGADPDGLNDCSGVVIKALSALPAEGGVIYFPQGTYLFKSTVSVGKNNVVFCGDGADKTRLLHDHDGLCFDVVTYKRGVWQKLLDGYTAGSKSVTVDDGSKFVKGGFAEIRQANDSVIMYTDPEWVQSWADSAVGQLFEVTDVNGNIISFRNRLHFSFDQRLTPQIRPQGFVCNTGFENFYIERLQGGNSTFQFKNAAYCWIRNIESYHTQKSHITNNTTIGCEYRDSYFHRSFSYGGGGCGYGVEFGYHCTDGLCENNLFDSLRHAMMVHVGTAGTVFGYNYSLHPVQGEGENNLNDGWSPPDISLHGHYAQMNLFEGNMVQEIGVGDYWGPMGPGNTFLRNVVQGDGVFIYDHSDVQNFIGNIATKWVTDSTSNSIYRHGERINGVLLWNENTDDYQIPLSYYLQEKPGFYNAMGWPSTGSDVVESVIPAVNRYQLKNHAGFEKIRKKQNISGFEIRALNHKTILIRSPWLSGDDNSVAVTTLDGKMIRTKIFQSTPEELVVQYNPNGCQSGVFNICINSKEGRMHSLFLPFLK